ncbi:MAG: hypothetical protein M5R36_06305 [Deltaproteobacteria bacterium]|nr:hypothetical protein [Deltaproteobacteria bacterium]
MSAARSSKSFPEEGCVVECYGTFVQGIFGVGGETHGKIMMACASPAERLDEAHIKPEHKDGIIVGGSIVTAAALKKRSPWAPKASSPADFTTAISRIFWATISASRSPGMSKKASRLS